MKKTKKNGSSQESGKVPKVGEREERKEAESVQKEKLSEKRQFAKGIRVVDIFVQLLNGSTLHKAKLSQRYQVSERTIQRDIQDIRKIIENELPIAGEYNAVFYDRKAQGYRMKWLRSKHLSEEEMLTVGKLLLSSRSLERKEMLDIYRKLLDCCDTETQKQVKSLLANEESYYEGPQHNRELIARIWELKNASRNCQVIRLFYQEERQKWLYFYPVDVRPDRQYFYLIGFLQEQKMMAEKFMEQKFVEQLEPEIKFYRIDKIQSFEILKRKFTNPFPGWMREEEFRKRIPFMQDGKLSRIKFLYRGTLLEMVQDLFPTLQVLSEENGVYRLQVEVFGRGIDTWFQSQGESVTVLS